MLSPEKEAINENINVMLEPRWIPCQNPLNIEEIEVHRMVRGREEIAQIDVPLRHNEDVNLYGAINDVPAPPAPQRRREPRQAEQMGQVVWSPTGRLFGFNILGGGIRRDQRFQPEDGEPMICEHCGRVHNQLVVIRCVCRRIYFWLRRFCSCTCI